MKNQPSPKPNLQDLCSLYLENHAKPNKLSWRQDESLITNYVLPYLASLTLIEITHRRIVELHLRIGQKSIYQANKVVRLLSKLFNFGIEFEIVKNNPASNIRKFKEVKRVRCLSVEELKSFQNALYTLENKSMQVYFQILLRTGLRTSELRLRKWTDVNFEVGVLSIEKDKRGKPISKALTPKVLELFRELKELGGDEDDFIFKGRKKGAPISHLNYFWKKIMKESGIRDLRPHDLRHTVGSLLSQNNVSSRIIQDVLNHSQISTTERYMHLTVDTEREALEKLEKIFKKK